MEKKKGLPRDYSGAVAYALNRLRNELPPELVYHNAMHTEGDVLPVAVQRCNLSNSDLHAISNCLNKHEDRPFLDLADTSGLIWTPVLPETADQLNGSTYPFMG
jgi:hypothetical protein